MPLKIRTFYFPCNQRLFSGLCNNHIIFVSKKSWKRILLWFVLRLPVVTSGGMGIVQPLHMASLWNQGTLVLLAL